MENILAESIACYRQVIAVMKRLEGALGGAAPESILDMQAELERCHLAAVEADKELNHRLEEGGETLPVPQMEERRDLMMEVARRNRLLTEKAVAIMAVVRADLGDLEQGRAVVKGYAGGPQEKGRRITGAF